MKALNYISNNKTIWYLLMVLISLIVTFQNLILGENHYWGGVYTFYNNYIIFKNSFFYLISEQNPYDYHLDKYADLFKYSPTFALFMGLFYYLPDWLGLSLWNLLNGLILLYAITTIPGFSNKKMLYLLLFVIIELVLSLQNCQTNSLLAGLTILSFTSMEKGNTSAAAFYICCGVFIKVFLIAACLLFLFYPNKLRSVLYLLIWSTLFLLLPAILIGFDNLFKLYTYWLKTINGDVNDTIALYKVGESYSVYRFFDVLAGSKVNKTYVISVGLLLFLFPLIQFKKYTTFSFRLAFLCLTLIWIVIFNHKAESPSYIIAMTGIGLWCLSQENNRFAIIVLFINLLFTSLFFTDLVPQFLKNNADKAIIKTFMPSITFLLIVFNLYTNHTSNDTYKEENLKNE